MTEKMVGAKSDQNFDMESSATVIGVSLPFALSPRSARLSFGGRMTLSTYKTVRFTFQETSSQVDFLVAFIVFPSISIFW